MDKKGFTAVELIIVIATIAVLAAVLLPRVTSMVEKRKALRLYDNIAKVGEGLTQFYKDCGTYPKNNAVGLLWNKNWATAGNVRSGIDPSNCWQGPYISTLPPNAVDHFNSPFNTTCTIVTNGGDINGNGNTTDIYVQCLSIPESVAELLERKVDGNQNIDYQHGNFIAQCGGGICTIKVITDEF